MEQTLIRTRDFLYEKKQEAFESKLELIQEEIGHMRWKLLCLNRFCWEAPMVKNDGI